MSTKKKVLVYRIGSLGDTVLALPCFHTIRRNFPDAHIVLLTNKPVMAKAASTESILGSGYFFDEVLNYPVGTRNFRILYTLFRQILSSQFDVLINLTPSRSKLAFQRDRLFFKAAGIRKFIGFPSRDEDFTVQIDETTGQGEWEAARLARRIQQLGKIDLNDDCLWDLRFTQHEIFQSKKILEGYEDRRILAISTGTKSEINDWGINNWKELLASLHNKLDGWLLIIIGASEDTYAAEEMCRLWPSGALNLCGKTPPRISALVLKKAGLFIGHDSGPMHLAAAVGVPCVGIFPAKVLPGQWFPKGSNNRVIYHKTSCAGCGLERCIEEKRRCILSITVDEVQDNALALLKSQERLNNKLFNN